MLTDAQSMATIIT